MPITVKRVTQREHGAEYQTWLVDGYVNGKRIRIRCKSEDEARIRKSEEETKAINSERSSRFIQTRLTPAQLNEAESCFDRLAPKYSLTEAVDHFLRNNPQPGFTITVGEASTKFLGSSEGRVRQSTLTQLKSTLGQFERSTGNRNVHEADHQAVERFLQSLRAKNGTDKAKPKTWNNCRADLHAFFEWCIRAPQKYVTVNPVSGTKRFRIDAGHVEVLSIEKCQELMSYVASYKDGRFVRFYAIALFAGVRPTGEITRLARNPELVDLTNGVIRITPAISKTRQSRQIKIRPNLAKWLKQFPGDILPVNSGHETAAIRKKFKLSHDVLRHSFCSAHVMAFGSFADAAIESGNSEKVIRSNYLNAIPKSQAKAFWKIEPR